MAKGRVKWLNEKRDTALLNRIAVRSFVHYIGKVMVSVIFRRRTGEFDIADGDKVKAINVVPVA